MASPRPTARQGALLLAAVLCACGMVALLAVAVAPARAQAGSVALGQIFPGRSVFAGEFRGRRAARTSLEEGGSKDAAQDGAAPADDAAEEPETGGAPTGSDAPEEEAGAGEAGSEEQAPPPVEDSGEAAPAEEGQGGEPAEETEEQAPSEEEDRKAAPTQKKVEGEEKSDTAAEEEKQEDSKPSDFLKGMVRRVAREVLPPAARAKLRDSSDNVQAANLQLAEARKLQRDSRKEEHKAMYAATPPQKNSPCRISPGADAPKVELFWVGHATAKPQGVLVAC